MILQKSLKDFFKKEIKIICLSIGGIYALFGVLALQMIKAHKATNSSLISNKVESFTITFNRLQEILREIWTIYMPFLILLGLSYLIYGYYFNKIKAKYQINLLLSVLSFVWMIAYIISSFKYLEVFFSSFSNSFEAFKYISYFFAGVGLVGTVVLFTVPQYIIGKRIKMQEKNK